MTGDGLPWPSALQAGIACGASAVLWLCVCWTRPTRVRTEVMAAAYEFGLISGLYAIWRVARELPFTHEAGALDRARQIDAFQNFLHLPTEISLQHFVIDHDWLARATNAYYATVHVPGLLIFLVWLFVRHRDRFPHWRNGLALVTLGCLIIRFVRVAPPRFIEELGFVNLSDRYGLGVYGPVGHGISDQFAAMPSIHVGWAAVVACGIFMSTTSRWRWLFVLHLPITMFVVAATGHHWWMDGIVAIGLLWGGLKLDTYVRARRAKTPSRAEPSFVKAR
ncbi:phosphatase PAP2 family protein [Aeromicrobium panaciterrae]|uniref:phosphatase PAP2 family protein n=1 Tax=Aeromicrobium panaciterrae TaxID=363861 RepID=UPI0031DBE609